MLWASFEVDISHTFGGITQAGIVAGYWHDNNGAVMYDNSRVYYIAIPDTSEAEKHLFAILADYRVRFDQQCLYVAETSQNARLI